MTVPMEYAHAVEAFDTFLQDAAQQANMTTRHQSFTMVEGVLLAFRRRLATEQAIAFAQALPPLLRALFLERWDPTVPPVAFSTRQEMTREVQALRRHHNLSPDSAIADVSRAIRRAVGEDEFNAVLDRLPPAAREFWSLTP